MELTFVRWRATPRIGACGNLILLYSVMTYKVICGVACSMYQELDSAYWSTLAVKRSHGSEKERTKYYDHVVMGADGLLLKRRKRKAFQHFLTNYGWGLTAALNVMVHETFDMYLVKPMLFCLVNIPASLSDDESIKSRTELMLKWC